MATLKSQLKPTQQVIKEQQNEAWEMWFEAVTHSAQSIPQGEASRSHPLPLTTSSGSSLSIQRQRGAHQQKDLPQVQIPNHQSRDPAGTPLEGKCFYGVLCQSELCFFKHHSHCQLHKPSLWGLTISQHLELDHTQVAQGNGAHVTALSMAPLPEPAGLCEGPRASYSLMESTEL